MPAIAPFGSWRSPITVEVLTAGGINIRYLTATDGILYWVEGRPHEGGRDVLVRRTPDGRIRDVVPADFNARTRVHEYGGGAVAVHGMTAVCASFADQRLYRVDGEGGPIAITADPPQKASHRYADGEILSNAKLMICVRERHESEGVVNEIVALPLDGSAAPRVLASGHDFFSNPRVSPDGRRLAWRAWDHPNMSWDGSEIFVADFRSDGSLADPTPVAGGRDEAVLQPGWSPDGTLHLVSDRSGWWNLYRAKDGQIEALAPRSAEFGLAEWTFGQSVYAFLGDGRLVCFFVRDGRRHLAIVDPRSGHVAEVAPDLGYISHPCVLGDRLAFIGGGDTQASAIMTLDPATGTREVIRRSLLGSIDPRFISGAQPLDFPTDNGRIAHALFYEPRSGSFVAPAGEQPPLLVLSHGGPTGMSLSVLSPTIQFWTSRGFAVVDVNYGGSTGYGREYRERLNGQWGIVDLHDCVNAAKHLASTGKVDPRRLLISGGSAGGYTTLCALVFTDVFAAGATYYGIADIATLARDMHKFESRYFDRLVGPYPEAEQTYHDRSPVHFLDRLRQPVIVFQGLDDKVVPPHQAEMIVEVLRTKGIPYAYLSFPGEGHGFRRAETIKRATEAELAFYSAILGFPLDEPIELKIENLS